MCEKRLAGAGERGQSDSGWIKARGLGETPVGPTGGWGVGRQTLFGAVEFLPWQQRWGLRTPMAVAEASVGHPCTVCRS